ncbi:MAG: MBL fold metallo-hydrolase [Gammaproteobacteria bacterium]|nr:MAG: MBL fold metallo-hydrolase [Gammaproteobacteria bacterium]
MSKITILVDNMAGTECRGEFGFSALIENGEEQLLFDVGRSDIFQKNADRLGIDLSKVKRCVLSHGHYDHGDGLEYFTGEELICHPGCFSARYRKRDNKYIGLKYSRDELATRFMVTDTRQPLWLSPSILFLGEIPRSNGFESQQTTFKFGDGSDDFVPDDSAMVLIDGEAITIIAGCSHSGICNIVAYAMEVTGKSQVRAILGGFHLKQNDLVTDKTLQYMQQINCEKVYPMHCTSQHVQHRFVEQFESEFGFAGMVIEV